MTPANGEYVPYEGVLGYVAVVQEDDGSKWTTPMTQDRDLAVRRVRGFSRDGLTCWVGEVRKVPTVPENGREQGS